MKINKQLTKYLAVNKVGLDGGSSLSNMVLKYFPHQLLIQLHIPGVAGENITILYNNHELTIYSNHVNDSTPFTAVFPLHKHVVGIATSINPNRILAIFKKNILEVLVPFEHEDLNCKRRIPVNVLSP